MTAIENLDRLAQKFLTAWWEVHGLRAGNARAWVTPDHLTVLIEGAFSQAEHKLAETQSGETLLKAYATELLKHICVTMSIDIQQATGRKMLSKDVSVSLEADQVMFIFKLASVTPQISPLSSASTFLQ